MEITHSTRVGALDAPKAWTETLAGQAGLAVAASLFVAVCAHLIVPLPFTPVPLTLGDFAVVLVGLALGPVAGFAALALYLAEGAMGLPVFSPAGPGGLLQLFGATGGYLMAYPIAAGLAGGLFRLLGRTRFVAALVAAAPASALLMVSGVSWLAFHLHLGVGTAFKMGAAPFIPGQVVKVIAAAGIATSVQRLRRK